VSKSAHEGHAKVPRQFERFFLELAGVFQSGPPDADGLQSLAASYGLSSTPFLGCQT
jgi:hypothetical protein